jgi:LmbE family N-acetylglucosaminyl deacetylase
MKNWIFLSTHFDDVVLSVGGMVWELTQRGEKVEIWTICAGDPPENKPLPDYAQMLHGFWELGDDVPRKRAIEDAACCAVLGAGWRRYTVPDCIYRWVPDTGDPIVVLPDDINKPLEPVEAYLIPQVEDFLRKNIPDGAEVVAPLSIGDHRDHVLTRKAADRLGVPVWHYVDYPYVIQKEYDLKGWIPAGAEKFELKITSQGLKAWQDGFAKQHSQIILFWPDEAEMRKAIEEYFQKGWGYTIWKF